MSGNVVVDVMLGDVMKIDDKVTENDVIMMTMMTKTDDEMTMLQD